MDELLIPTEIIRTNRKTLALIINSENKLIVRAPLLCKDSYIMDFIKQKANWIILKRTKLIQSNFLPLKICNGEEISILGNVYKLKLLNVKSAQITGEHIIVPTTNSKNRLILFLKKTLKNIIENKISNINKVHNFNINSISISSAKTNWGSCSADNKLHFTYKLILCPEQIVDYIIVHELVHTRIKNHSKNYWNNVKKIYPNYKQCEKWLKDNSRIVDLL